MAAYHAPPSLGFSSQEHWSGVPFPSSMRASEVAQLYPTLCDPMDCSLPGSSIHGIFQAKVLEWGAIAFSDDNPRQHIKSRDITLPTKVHLAKAMVFPGVMYRCESWIIRNAEHRRIDVFELWCWRRLLRVPWTTRRSNQSILKEISPEYSLEGLMLKQTSILWLPDPKKLSHWKRS